MIQFEPSEIEILYCDGSWAAIHDENRCDGPLAVEVHEQNLAENVSFYVDDVTAESALADRVKAFRKAGVAVVQSCGHLPFGAETAFTQTCRYAANHVRITFDLRWRRGDTIKRHLGVGSLFLPGRWRRYRCVPPCLHLAEGVLPSWHDVPEEPVGSGMLGHWHRPPLALVFEREDGARLEVGTGDDVWRWEQNLEFGPEKGNYKVMAEPDGLRILREPLMTCEEVTPRARDYRLTTYLAWTAPDEETHTRESRCQTGKITFHSDGQAALPGDAVEVPALLLDFAAMPTPASCQRVPAPAGYALDGTPAAACWRCNAVQKAARRIVRQIAALPDPGILCVKGLVPGPCWNSSHVGQPDSRPAPHWDMSAILDFAEWTRQQLGPEWDIVVDPGTWGEHPAMLGIMRENGFRTDIDEEHRDDE
jgi:hypothetical protein